MTQLLAFANAGEIDPRLITTIGVNVKPGPGAFGQFGSGLKYAIAGVVRLGGKVIIQSGLVEHHFRPVTDRLRGKEFTFIEMLSSSPIGSDGPEPTTQLLAFTTDLGRHWQPWMLYRELWCNALDEYGDVEVLDEYPEPEAGRTTVLVQCPELLQVHQEPGAWRLSADRQLLWQTTEVECFSGPSRVGYYHGVKVLDFAKPTVFTYNVLGRMELTEDRTVAGWEFTGRVAREVIGRDRPVMPAEVLRRITQGTNDHAERDWYWPSWVEPRTELLTAAGLSPNLRDAIASRLPPKPILRSVFDDLQEAAPPVPGITCPWINQVQQQLRDAIRALAVAAIGDRDDLLGTVCAVEATLTDLLDDGRGAESPLERLRELNTALRESGVYWRDQCKQLTMGVCSPVAAPVMDSNDYDEEQETVL